MLILLNPKPPIYRNLRFLFFFFSSPPPFWRWKRFKITSFSIFLIFFFLAEFLQYKQLYKTCGWAAENYCKEKFLNGFTMKATMCMFGYKNENHIYESGDFHLKIFPHFWQPKPSKKTFFIFLFLISHFGDISPVKKKSGRCFFRLQRKSRSLRTPLCIESGRYYELELPDHVHRLETQQK